MFRTKPVIPRLPIQTWLSIAIIALVLPFAFNPVWAATAETQDPDWLIMLTNLLGGLALFLFGMDQMSDALKAVAGERMKTVLSRLTTNRFMGAITGAFVTAVIQSSSVTTVLVVGFISAGLMSMAQSIGVIMGANVGTTITAQIVAFKVTKFALVMIAFGFGLLFLSKRDKLREYGSMIMGLGLIFFGMHIMSEAMHPLRNYQPFLDLMIEMENPLLGILVSAAFTALVQSSSATTGIVIVMASQGFITLPAGIALAFGANIGTCVTAGFASLGKPREAVRAAVVHVLFNVAGVLLWLGLIGHLAEFVTWLSPSHTELSGIDRLARETPRQIANAHTIFNIANTLLFIGFTGVFARLVERLVPDRPLDLSQVIKPKYLEESIIDTPPIALNSARLEILRSSKIVMRMLDDIGPAFLSAKASELGKVRKLGDDFNQLHGFIITYLGEVGRGGLSKQEFAEMSALMNIVNDLREISELVEADLVSMGIDSARQHLVMSDKTELKLEKIHQLVRESLQLCLDALKNHDTEVANRVLKRKNKIKKLAESTSESLQDRLRADAPNRLALYTMEVSVVEKLWRIYYFTKRISRNVAVVKLVEPVKESAADAEEKAD